jgi:hypothetical protein
VTFDASWETAELLAVVGCWHEPANELSQKTGAQRLALAELVLDLQDLAHMAIVAAEPVTMDTLGRVRGDREPATTERAFFRMRAWLAERGVSLERRHVEDEPLHLEFDAHELKAVIRCEIKPAVRALREFRMRTGRRDRLP